MPEMLADASTDDAAINRALSRLGELLSVSRAYIMFDSSDGCGFKTTHEWANLGIAPAVHFWPIGGEAGEAPLTSMLGGRDPIRRHVRDMPAELRERLVKQGVASLLLAPLHRGERCVGLVGFDCCGSERDWKEEEGQLLRMLADMVMWVLERRELCTLRKIIAEAKAVLGQIGSDSAEPGETAERADTPVTLREAERRIIAETLRLYNGNKLRAAKHLGLTWPALDRRCKKLGITVKRKL